jgi:RNA polymerase sigma-70 factor, ECF subfamily
MPEDPGHQDPIEVGDADLLQRAASGDRQAFELIYRRYHQAVYRFARAMTGSAEVAEDVTQEVFVALINELPRYDSARAAFTTYLYGIARNLSRNQWRRDQRRLALERIGFAMSRPASDPLNRLEEAEAAAAVRRALQALPLRYRELIILCDLHGFAYADAAVVVRTSVGAVRARLHRARHLLRDRLRRALQRTATDRQNNPARCAI